jgi:membrane-associated protease RseP (regulator of RpoE activity)
VSYLEGSDIVRAELADAADDKREARPRRRRVVLPLVLFLLTCGSTFFVGATGWEPLQTTLQHIEEGFYSSESDAFFLMPLRLWYLEHWRSGLIYMACVLAILLTHEMGHFVLTVVYRVRASLPFFIPLPISPIGTMGAVIAMDGLQANRRQIFDIGLAGPLAGLVVAIPITWIGIQQLDLSAARPGLHTLDLPLLMRLLVDWVHPGQYDPRIGVPLHLVNPYLMAGWVGLLVTGLNMMPVSQLDGGHVLYALFGRGAHWLARGFLLFAFVYLGIAAAVFGLPPYWILMAFLVLLIGTDHPPTKDDTVPLGWLRVLLGIASLLIPVFCFVPHLRL